MNARALLAHGGALVAGALLVFAAAQPLFTDDAWWHLALGRAFAQAGPWLVEDPLLFAAQGPPAPAAWLFDLLLFGVYEVGGFNALRALHGALVAANLALAWGLLRRASGSALAASAGTVAFLALATYRFAQLRPHLLSTAFALLLYRLLIADGRPPSARRIAAAALLFALWANLHAGFPVGLLMLFAAALALALPAWRGGAEADARRARGLGLACALGLAASALNPAGLRAHLARLAAGTSTPSLGRVVDEWSAFHPFSWPQPTLPPTPVAWLLVWGLLLALAWLAPRALAALRGAPGPGRLDPALLGVAGVSLALLLGGVRFLWLGIFPLLLVGQALAPALARPRVAWGLALAPLLLLAAFLRWGDWPLVTRSLSGSLAYYAEPYAAHKYYAQPIWLAREAGLEGRLYTDYYQAGFAGFWLAPRVKTLSNGTLNVSEQTLAAAAALASRRGLAEGESFEELLDRLELDLFLGIRLPEAGHAHRPWARTTGHLAGTPGWIPLFRNVDSSLFLRDLPRNRENLARVARHYADRGVPFDPQRGFDPVRVAREAPGWAEANGLVPRGFGTIEHVARTQPGSRGDAARDRLADLWTLLGAHEQAVQTDRALLEGRSGTLRARRRLVWNLLQLRRHEEARQAAEEYLASRPRHDRISHTLAEAARGIAGLSAADERALLAALPVYARAEVPRLLAGLAAPAPREAD